MPTWVDALTIGIEAAASQPAPEEPGQGREGKQNSLWPYLPSGSINGRATMTERPETLGSFTALVNPIDSERVFRGLDLSDNALDKLPTWKLLEILVDINPELSSALWTFCRSCNPGWKCTVHTGYGEAAPKSAAGQEVIDGFIRHLKNLYGSVDIPINRLIIGAFMRGAFYGELVLGSDARTPIDIATPDPRRAKFMPFYHPLRGKIWLLGQVINGEWQRLDQYATIRYLPIDPLPDSPYGRSVGAAALFTAIFLLSLMRDLKRVVQQQGYPRIDLEIPVEEILKLMPEMDQNDPEKFLLWAQAVIAQVEEAYSKLQPDDAYVHLSTVKVHRAVGTVDANSLSAVSGLISALERQVVRAVKTMPLLMSVAEGTSETQANRQWEIYVAGVKSLQHLGESLLEHLFQQVLTAQGIAGIVRFRFAELRASELLRDAQTMQLNLLNAWNSYRLGYTDQATSARMGAGVVKPDQDTPRFVDSGLTTPQAIMSNASASPGASPDPIAPQPPSASIDGAEQLSVDGGIV